MPTHEHVDARLIQGIDLGDNPNSGNGDTTREAWDKVNRNFMTLMAAHLELLNEIQKLRLRIQRLERD